MHSTSRHRQHGSGGFSTIELMMVLVILGILVSLASPSFGAFIDRTRTQRALDQLVSDVTFARMLAVQRGGPAAYTVAADGGYAVTALDADGAWTTVRSGSLRNDYPGVTFEAAELRFSSRGLITNLETDSHLKVTGGRGRDSIFVSPAGRVYRDF